MATGAGNQSKLPESQDRQTGGHERLFANVRRILADPSHPKHSEAVRSLSLFGEELDQKRKADISEDGPSSDDKMAAKKRKLAAEAVGKPEKQPEKLQPLSNPAAKVPLLAVKIIKAPEGTSKKPDFYAVIASMC